MSGSQGLIGFEGCCCSPDPENPCDDDVDEFEFDPSASGSAFYINPVSFYARFSIQTVYINMGWYTPQSVPTSCTDFIEDDSDCCGGISGTEICCVTSQTCDGICPRNSCLCPPCDPNSIYQPCGGEQGTYGIPTLESDLNVDGDGFAVMCCDCANPDLYIFYTQRQTGINEQCTYRHYLEPDCYDSMVNADPCPNQAEDVAFLFNGNFTPNIIYGDVQYKIPCDNSTVSAIQSEIYGYIDFVKYVTIGGVPVVERQGELVFSMANVDFWQGATETTCNTLMLRFAGQAKFCNVGNQGNNFQDGTATWAKKYAPPSNLKTAGLFTIGKYYKIKFIGTTNFTTIGALGNTIGLVFQATGVGAGTGTAYQARTEQEVANTKIGNYYLRHIDTEQIVSGEYDIGDRTWGGVERNTAVDPIHCECECIDPVSGTCSCASTQGSCGDAISATYATCYNMNTDVMPNISNVVRPQNIIVVNFT